MDSRNQLATGPSRAPLITPTFALVALASLAYFTAAGMTIPALPRFVSSTLGGGNTAVGVVFGAFSVSAVLLRPPAGTFGDRRGRRPLMVVGAVLAAVSILAYGLAPNAAVLVVLRLVTGAGEALFFVGMLTTFTDLAPAERRGEAMSLASLALYIGIGLGPVLAEVVTSQLGLAAVWVGAAATCFVAAALALLVPETRPDVQVDAAAGEATQVRRFVHPGGILPGAVLLASIVGMAGFLAFVPLHVFDIGMSGSGAILFLFAGVVVLVRSAGRRLPDVLGPARAIRAALTFSVVGLVIIATWHLPVGLIAGTAVLGLGVALLTPSVFALAAAGVSAGERSQVMATTSAFLDIAFGVGPVTMGIVAATFGRPAAFLAGAVAAMAGLVLVVVTRLGQPPVREQPVRPAPAPIQP